MPIRFHFVYAMNRQKNRIRHASAEPRDATLLSHTRRYFVTLSSDAMPSAALLMIFFSMMLLLRVADISPWRACRF